jgi:folate-binding protein YgfZ
MEPMVLHAFHEGRGAGFAELGEREIVANYGNSAEEHRALRTAAGVMDLSARGRLVMLGADRQQMLNGQVTNNVRDLAPGHGCYAALVNAKARMISDLNIYALPNEVLLDCEPGMAAAVAARLEKFIVMEDVQVVDASPHYGLLSVQGPRAQQVVERLGIFPEVPQEPWTFASVAHPDWGDLYLMWQSRTGDRGFDLFAPNAALPVLAGMLEERMPAAGGRLTGWDALEVARIEAGVPRYGVDMTEATLAPEVGLNERMISYEKGCYSGQEVIARIRTYGQVAKAFRGLRLDASMAAAPAHGTKLFKDGKEVGFITSATWSPSLEAHIALGYVRRECNQPGNLLAVGGAGADAKAEIVPLPFVAPSLSGP